MTRVITIFALILSLSLFAQNAADSGAASPSIQSAAASSALAAEDTAAQAGVDGSEEAAQPAHEPETSDVITIRKIFVDGGWIMYVITALSFLGIALVIFYILTMREAVLFPRTFILYAQETAERGDWELLRETCSVSGTAAAKIIIAAVEQCQRSGKMTYEALCSAMEDEGGRQAGELWQRLQYLMDVAVIAPMVGLLGTVWGMMVSFGGIENGAEFAKKAETLASGISQAMYTTFGGLIVGIMAMAFYDVIRGHLNRLTSSMETACASVLCRLAAACARGGMVPEGK